VRSPREYTFINACSINASEYCFLIIASKFRGDN
jgi:hypothetical protein